MGQTGGKVNEKESDLHQGHSAVIYASGKISMCETIEIVEQLVRDKQLAEYEEQRADEL